MSNASIRLQRTLELYSWITNAQEFKVQEKRKKSTNSLY